MNNLIRIIGTLDNGSTGITPAALAHIARADLLIGSHRVLALFENVVKDGVERKDLTGHLKEIPQWIKIAHEENQQIVVLATGDPLYHGVAAFLINKLGADAIEVIPAVSTIQWVFAKFSLAWHEATLVSVHAKDSGEWEPSAEPGHNMTPLIKALGHRLIALLTSPENSPDRIARAVMAAGYGDDYTMRIAEKLHTAEEQIIGPISISEAAKQKYAEPNVVILQRVTQAKGVPVFGMPDESYTFRSPDKKLITRREVRAVVLARLALTCDALLWDIGAGSGSVGLEAARICAGGHVWAMEKNEADFEIAQKNRRKFRVNNYTIVNAKAPDGLEKFPDPDAVFIGGSGGRLAEIIELVINRLRPGGRLVMNFITIENFSNSIKMLADTTAISWDVTQLQISRSEPILLMHRMKSENLVWIVSAKKDNA